MVDIAGNRCWKWFRLPCFELDLGWKCFAGFWPLDFELASCAPKSHAISRCFRFSCEIHALFPSFVFPNSHIVSVQSFRALFPNKVLKFGTLFPFFVRFGRDFGGFSGIFKEKRTKKERLIVDVVASLLVSFLVFSLSHMRCVFVWYIFSFDPKKKIY